jgi:hypothetical protein
MESELIGGGHAAFTGEFGANTRETQKRTCFFSLSFTMQLEFNEEFVVLTCQLHDTFIN